MVTLNSSPVFSQEAADFSFLRPLKPTLLFTAFWRFAAERQRVFWRRAARSAATVDERSGAGSLQVHQRLPGIRPGEPIPHPLGHLRGSAGTTGTVLPHAAVQAVQPHRDVGARSSGRRGRCIRTVSAWSATTGCCRQRWRGARPSTPAAYIMPSGGKGAPFARKHRMHLELLARMLRDELPERMADVPTMAQAFDALRAYPTIGDFLAYQYATDINYSPLTDFSETEFVVPGPGALSGLSKCFADTGGLTDAEVIRLVQERQVECFAAVGVTFPSLPGRELAADRRAEPVL